MNALNSHKMAVLVVLIVAVIGAIFYLNSQKVGRSNGTEAVTVIPRASSEPTAVKKEAIPSKYLSVEEKSKQYELAKEITTPDGFINTDGKPITISEFVGKKAVLVDFWTYSCINCQRTTPYLNAWYEKYKDKGFVIIGVHTPEFEFEKVYQNVLDATKRLKIEYPVVLDNDYSTWNAYRNRYWPRKYLIDIDGYIVYDHIGEGGYEETEKKIQEVLNERMAALGEGGTIGQAVTKEVPAENGARSPETYFGSARNDKQKDFLFPYESWNITPEFAQNSSSNASIVYTYTAKNVFFVAESDTETVIEVLRDSKSLGSEAGPDIIKTADGKTIVKIKEARLYKIIQGSQSGTHTLELKIQKPGLKAFTFTFG